MHLFQSSWVLRRIPVQEITVIVQSFKTYILTEKWDHNTKKLK